MKVGRNRLYESRYNEQKEAKLMYDRSQESGYSGGGGFMTGQVHKELLRMPMILRVDLGASL